MKKRGILNSKLIQHIAMLGHKDTFMICDAGMPIPSGVEIIDLAVCKGVPSFNQILDCILEETEIENFLIATELENNDIYENIHQKLINKESRSTEHCKLKQESQKCKFAVRTGECSSFANIILCSGVNFD